MTRDAPLGRLPIGSSSDILTARQRVRDAAARLGFDLFDQVQLATGVSELGREIAASGGGELEVWISSTRPRRLVIGARGVALRDVSTNAVPGVIAARRLIGPPLDGASGEQSCTFSRALPKSARLDNLAESLSASATDPFSELRHQDTELLRMHEEIRRRDSELESVNRELEETNRGVLALYAELDDKAESIRQISDERARFLSNVTHELRTPLISITSLCRLLLTQGDRSLEDEQAKQITYIQKSAQDLLDFVSDLLDLAKVEAGKVTVRAAPFEAEETLAALRGMFRPLSADTGVPVIFDLSPIPTLETDESKVSQILRNLISNALKFTETGEIRVAASYEAKADEVLFAATDTGIGIAAADLDQIFDEFVQVDTRHGRRHRSSGLGLPLSRKLAELMGGSITVKSKLGEGSTFSLRLPRKYAPQVPQTAPESGAGYVLVVDDDQISRYVAKEQLERLGWRVVEAADGEMALKLAREGECRAILLDLTMPGISGFEVLERLGEDPSTSMIPVVIRTSLPVGDIDAGSVSRAAAVFSKSDSMQSVVDLIASRTASQPARPRGTSSA